MIETEPDMSIPGAKTRRSQRVFNAVASAADASLEALLKEIQSRSICAAIGQATREAMRAQLRSSLRSRSIAALKARCFWAMRGPRKLNRFA